MKKFAISLIALAAVSTASFAAGNHSGDLRDSDTYIGKFATPASAVAADANAFAVANDGQALTNFERLTMISEQNVNGRH